MRECHNNYAHGPMKLKTKKVTVQYKDKNIQCDKTIYVCDICGFELHEKWMAEKLEKQVQELYQEKYGD